MMKTKLCLFLLGFSMTAAHVQAQTLVTFNTVDSLTASGLLQGTNTEFNDNTLNDAQQRQPSTGDWNGGIFYGGSGSTSQAVNAKQIEYQATNPDRLQVSWGAAATQQDFASLFFIKSAQFSNAWNSSNQQFELSITARIGSDSSTVTAGTLRMVIQNAGTWYVSDDAFTIAKSTGGTLASYTAVVDDEIEAWRIYDPVTSILGAGAGNLATPTFTNVQAVGWVMSNSRDGSVSTGNQHYYTSFSVTAIPEPSSLALLALGFAGAVLGLRRRVKRG